LKALGLVGEQSKNRLIILLPDREHL